MYEVIFLIILAIIWMIFASIQDLKIREVANWLNFSLIVFALGFRFFYCLFSEVGFSFFYQGLIGLGIFLILGNLFYYSRIFGGGDAKLMIALGAILPFNYTFIPNLKIFALFFALFLFVSSFYGIFWSLVLAIKNSKKFKKEFYKLYKKYKKVSFVILLIGGVFLGAGFISEIFFFLGIFLIFLMYFYFFAKAVENSCMIIEIPVSQLREGDWLCSDIKLQKGKVLSKNWEGLTKKEIRAISKKFKKVKIKQGIPFVPVFLIDFLILIYLWLNNFYYLI